ncbi:hypothetical protein F5879DRAFT_990506 [Lentinula edodes]|nr:hypothetical protein F5879DRAFT_990506 [Lentinula edodes]
MSVMYFVIATLTTNFCCPHVVLIEHFQREKVRRHHGFEPCPMSSHRQFEKRSSPPDVPPIATLSTTNSPDASSFSLDRSSVSTPPIRRSSPRSLVAPQYHNLHSQSYYSHSLPPIHHYPDGHQGYDSHKGSYPVSNASHGFDNMGGIGSTVRPMNSTLPGCEPYSVQMPTTSYPGGPLNNSIPVLYTEDAATKLSNRVRRRCFNCFTTNTSTWRRSSLNPGKMLCNKCGLFERTHGKPRPEQFLHRRGPVASSTLPVRSAPIPVSLPSSSMQKQSIIHDSLPSPDSVPISTYTTFPPVEPAYYYSGPPDVSLAPLNSVVAPTSNGNRHESGK